MPQIVVFNKHCESDTSWCFTVNVMRPSVLGNPFPITPTSPREIVIKKYRIWLFEQLKNVDSQQYREIQRLAVLYKNGADIGLICCCWPLECHASVIASAVKYYASLLTEPTETTVS